MPERLGVGTASRLESLSELLITGGERNRTVSGFANFGLVHLRGLRGRRPSTVAQGDDHCVLGIEIEPLIGFASPPMVRPVLAIERTPASGLPFRDGAALIGMLVRQLTRRRF